VIVLASHLPGAGHAAFEVTKHRVVPARCQDGYDYWQALSEWWESDQTIINVEHDVECDDSHMEALLVCPHPVCSWMYEGHWRTTGQPGGVLAHICDNRPGRVSDRWATWSAIGLIKLTPQARTRQLRREPWMALENAVNDAITGPICLHGPPCNHHHW
jgi:hypothetical protein